MTINQERLMRNIFELGKIGFEEGKGTTRLSYSENYNLGREYVKNKMLDAGLEVFVDPVGNLCGRLPGNGKIISLGSHLDSVPNGGIYDGAYGVLAAIECVTTIQEIDYKNVHPIEIIAFIEEEGNVIGGTFGSKSFAGVDIDKAMEPKMDIYSITKEDVKASKRNKEDYLCYLELHIEQGGILETENIEIGIVGGIVGILRHKAVVKGDSNHSGSTPMNLRNDAFVKTCEIVTKLMNKVKEKDSDMVCTVGCINVQPGAVNVIPGRVEFIIEQRNSTIQPMYEVIEELGNEYSSLEFTTTEYINQKETICDDRILELARESAKELGFEYKEMFSGAGHDLINMGLFIPSGLFFIPSKNGISHNINEYSSPESIGKGSELLLKILLEIDKGALKKL